MKRHIFGKASDRFFVDSGFQLKLASFKLIYVSRDNLKIDEIYKKTYIKYIQFGKLDMKLLFLMWFFVSDDQKNI